MNKVDNISFKESEFTENEINEMTQLHIKRMPEGFLPLLGEKAVMKLYKSLAHSKYCNLIAAVSEDKIIGFISSTIRIKSLYLNYLRFYPLENLRLLLKAMSGYECVGIAELAFYPFKRRSFDLPEVELITFAVSEYFGSRGLGDMLYQRMILKLKRMGQSKMFFYVGKDQTSAICFYEKHGAEKKTEIHVHRKKTSHLMIQTL